MHNRTYYLEDTGFPALIHLILIAIPINFIITSIFLKWANWGRERLSNVFEIPWFLTGRATI